MSLLRHTRLGASPIRGMSLALALLAAACSGTDETGAYDLVIAGASVVDVDAGTTLPDRTVAVRDGRIAAVWAAADVPRDLAAARTIDAAGQWLIPGLWDAHVHFRGGTDLAEENLALLPLYPLTGVTTVRDAGGDLTPELMAWRDAMAAGELLGPRILTSGPKLDGPQPMWEGSIALSEPSQVPAALDSLEALGVDYVKLYDGTMSPEVFMAAVREAEARGLRVTGHMPLGVDLLEAIAAGFDATEHLFYALKASAGNHEEVTARVRAGEMGFWDAFPAILDAPDADRQAEVLAAMARGGTAVVPTLHIGQVLLEVGRVDHTSDPELAYIPPGILDTYQERVAGAVASPPSFREMEQELETRMGQMVAPMARAGVTILAGSDAGPFNSFTYPGFALHAELEELVGVGLSPAEALRTATAAPADFMGLGEDLGRVAPGYLADLVLLEANPLGDIGATRQIAFVIQGGSEVLDRAAIDAALAQLAARWR